MKNIWLMPSYYNSFKCKCEKCRHTCCHGWQIPISKKEYERLITIDCDENMRHRLDVSFKVPDYIDENRYRIISFNYLGDCPIQKDGLCKIHSELGEESLPKICRLYPRSLKKVNNRLIACCSSSCERVIEMLLESDSLNLIEVAMDEEPSLSYDVDEDIIKQLLKFHELMKDRSTSLKRSIIDICSSINKEEFEKDFNCEINPINEGLNLLNRLATNGFLADIKDEISERYRNNNFQYELDKENFEKLFPNWMHYFENVLNNSLLYENFPFVDNRFDKTNAYKGLCASYGLLRLVCVGYTSIHTSKDDLIDCIAALFHLIDHTAFYYNVNVLEKTPAILLNL